MKFTKMKNIILSLSMLLMPAGCSQSHTVGKDIKEDDISDFYWTESASTNPSHYQRYRLYAEDGQHYFHHEYAVGYTFDLSENDIVSAGTKELNDTEWQSFYELIEGGTVTKISDNTDSGYDKTVRIYWSNDKGNIREFSFENNEKAYAFEQKCKDMKTAMEQDQTVKAVFAENGIMQYIHFGNPDKETLVILPGMSLRSVMLYADAIIPAYETLAEEYDIYLFDNIKTMPQGYSVYDMCTDTVTALEKLGVEHMSIMGVSLGGMTGMQMAVNYPDKVDALVLCSAASRLDEEGLSLIHTWRELAHLKDNVNLIKSFGEHVYTANYYEANKEALRTYAEEATDLDYQNFVICADAISAFDIYDDLEEIQCPVFVVASKQDKVLGVQVSYDIIEKLNCENYIYEGYSHAVYDEAPDYQTRVKEFLDQALNINN